MSYTDEFRGILAIYNEEVNKVQKERKFFDGVLGMGNHPGYAACHENMDRAVEELCQRAMEENDSEEKAKLSEAVLQAESRWEGPGYARLMLAAIQRHVRPLIFCLDRADRNRLAVWYEKQYPKRKRLPIQDEIAAELKKA